MQGSPRHSRGRRDRAGNQENRDSDLLSPRDIDLNLQDDSAKNGLSTSERRKQNTERRSNMGERQSLQESDEEEIDVKKMKVNFEEYMQIMDAVKEINEDFCKSTKVIQSFDKMSMQAECQIKTHQLSYRILKDNLYSSNPNFDHDKIEQTLHQLKLAVENDATNLSSLKGEYFSTHDTVVNKDTYTFKIDQVKRTRQKQLRVLDKFESNEAEIHQQSEKIAEFEDKFHGFEKNLFKDQLMATTRVVEETNTFMEEIDNQMDKMTQDILKVKTDIAEVTPQTKEQIEKLNGILTQIASVEKILEFADEAMERNDQNKEKLQTTHEECKAIVSSLEKLEMVEMVAQSRKIEKLVVNHKDWEALYASLKGLQENQIEVGDFDLAKAIADAKKYIENVALGRKDDYDDLIKKIQKSAKAIRDGGEEQQQRLDEFTNKNIEGDIGTLIPDADLLFLNKEVARYNGSIKAMQVQKDETLEDSTKIEVDMKSQKKGLSITPEDLHQLRQNLKSLEKQQNVDLPRIKKNIDMLEAFAIKALKNKLNEDNKKSQNQISLMKRNYEDLQKEIDNLNNKLGKVKEESAALQKRLDNDDKEKDNDVKFKIEDKIAECDKDINGHKSEQPGEEKDASKPPSLQARKKDIIASINKMVNQFNENNKQIKENNKTPKTEKEMNDLIAKNKEIQEECKAIDDKVNEGKVFAEQIDERLNNILDPTIPELDAKYDEKNGLIDECDDLFDGCEEKLKGIDANLQDQLKKVEDAIEKLNDAGPINNPSSSDRDNKDFIAKVQDLTEKGDKLRGELEAIQGDMQDSKDKLMEIIQPLNELGDREVKTPEVQKILEKLKEIENDLKEADADLGETKKEVDNLNDEVDKLIESEKNAKIQQADEELGLLDKALGDLADVKKEAQRKLAKYNDMIAAAKENEGQADPQLMGTLKKLEKEADGIKDQLKDIEVKEKDIKAKREDAKTMIDDAYANPDNYTPIQIDGIIDGLGDLRAKVDGLNDKSDKIEQDVDKRIEDLKDLLAKNNATKALDKEIGDLLAQMKDDLSNLKDLLNKMPDQIAKLLETLQEMKKGSTPDESADYWEERKDIDRWIDVLTVQIAEIKKIKAQYEEKEKAFKNLQAETKKAQDIPSKQALRDSLQKESKETQDLLEKAYDCQDAVVGTQKEMSDCQIPVNIKMRANEIDQFRERLANITDEFKELKAADDAYEGTSESEQEIKSLIEKIDRKLKSFETEKQQHQQYQKQKLEAYREKDIFGPDNAVIVREVRTFKEKIADTNRRLKELDDIMRDLNNKLIAQDMENAAKLLGHKSKNLRDRLQVAKGELDKIAETGKDMDGNTSHQEEEEFIDALKEEMPEVFKNIEGNFDQLDKIDEMIAEVVKNKDIDVMQELKGQIDDAQTKVEQCEGLVNKLENEIIEWDATKKLCKRDEELGEIDALLKEFKTDMNNEKEAMEKGKEKQEQVLNNAKDQNDIDDANYLLEGVANYLGEIADLEKDILKLDGDRKDCFDEFDADIPSSVKVERNKRNQAAGRNPRVTPSTASDKPEDMYYKLKINARYKGRIQALLKRLRDINQRRRDLMEKYAGLKKDLNVVKAPKVYKAVKGDKVDELWCWHLNKAQIDLDVKRLGPGKYLFGTRNIMCKIINGKLVVRVGGGYMSADEFIEQYGRIEILKAMKEAGDPDFEEARNSLANIGGRGRSGSNPRGSAKAYGMGEMRDLMKKQLDQAQVYEDKERVNTGGIGSRPGSGKRGTVAQNLASPKGSPAALKAAMRQGSAGRR